MGQFQYVSGQMNKNNNTNNNKQTHKTKKKNIMHKTMCEHALPIIVRATSDDGFALEAFGNCYSIQINTDFVHVSDCTHSKLETQK